MTTYRFEAAGADSTKLKLEVHASGELEEGAAEIVQQVWEHFLFQQFRPYVETGKHLNK